MLTALLNKEGSRAQHLLKSIGSSGDFSILNNGVSVAIPSNSSHGHQLLTQWTKLTTNSPTTDASHTTSLAVSAVVPPAETLSIICRQCGDTGPEGSARAFVFGPMPLQIVLCTNRLSLMNSEALESALVHELIHIYDLRRRHMDFSDCHQLAYTEVRAAREGECRAAWWPASCVKERALTSTNIMFGEAGRACIRAVFDTAMQDTMPFARTNTQQPTQNTRQSERWQWMIFWSGYNNDARVYSFGFERKLYKHWRWWAQLATIFQTTHIMDLNVNICDCLVLWSPWIHLKSICWKELWGV